MDERPELLYRLPGIKEYEDISLAVLYEYCGVLEEQLNTIMDNLPDDHRQIIEAYIDARNQLELQSIEAWASQTPTFDFRPTEPISPPVSCNNL